MTDAHAAGRHASVAAIFILATSIGAQMSFESVNWFAWVIASLWHQAQTKCDLGTWLTAFAATFFIIVLAHDLWTIEDRAHERK